MSYLYNAILNKINNLSKNDIESRTIQLREGGVNGSLHTVALR